MPVLGTRASTPPRSSPLGPLTGSAAEGGVCVAICDGEVMRLMDRTDWLKMKNLTCHAGEAGAGWGRGRHNQFRTIQVYPKDFLFFHD